MPIPLLKKFTGKIKKFGAVQIGNQPPEARALENVTPFPSLTGTLSKKDTRRFTHKKNALTRQ